MHDIPETDPWSATSAQVYDALADALEAGRRVAVATVTAVEGSAYRRPGAKMLVDADGGGFGAVTAGCLEDAVTTTGTAVIEDGEPRTELYDLMDDEWGLGLGCNGIIDLLVEPADDSWRYPLDALAEKRPVAVLTAVDSTDPDVAVGDRTVLDETGRHDPGTDRRPLPEAVADAVAGRAAALRESGQTEVHEVETTAGRVSVLVDGLEPVPDLLLFGSQNDVHPVTSLARQVGFHVTVASPRGGRADRETFPNAHRVEAVSPDDVDDAIRAPEHTYAVVMSHNVIDDRLAVERLLDAVDVPYIGLMGPQDRFEQLLDGLDADRPDLVDAAVERVSTPVGLDLGGGEPAQIALSVVAEALAVKNGRDGGRLAGRTGPIHRRTAE